MSLFGKKGKKEKTEKSATNTASYPKQSTYPTQSYVSPAGPQMAPSYQPPPPYSAAFAPGSDMNPNVMGPGPQQPMQTHPPQYYNQPPPQQTVIVQGGFDAGARFDGASRPAIPPPPPGCALHPAQIAALNGQNVVVTQRPGDYWSGGSSGGYTFF